LASIWDRVKGQARAIFFFRAYPTPVFIECSSLRICCHALQLSMQVS